MSKEIPNARLHFILARDAPVGVIFRRGPSKWVQIIKWNILTDQFEFGQWFHGRIYELRSDLSPDGTKMIYFAQKINRRSLADTEYTYAWTAISKPPYLTALVLWPKGNCWHGGGLFMANDVVWLNHCPEDAYPHRNHMPPPGLKVIPNPQAHGEDYPVLYRRLERDGWVLSQEWQGIEKSHGYATLKPEIMHKNHPNGPLVLIMESSWIKHQRYIKFKIESNDSYAKVDDAEWADWDQRGRLIYVSEGKVFASNVANGCVLDPKELANFNNLNPENIRTPDWAMKLSDLDLL